MQLLTILFYNPKNLSWLIFGQLGVVCRMVGPIIDELSNDYDGKAIVGKVTLIATKSLLPNTEFAISQLFCYLRMGNLLIEK